MTRGEWAEIAAKIDALWTGKPFGEDRELAYYEVLQSYGSQLVLEAVLDCTKDGKAFPPSAAEILGYLRKRDMPKAPSWDEAWPAIHSALRRTVGVRGGAPQRLKMVTRYLETEHEVYVAFVQRLGLDRIVNTEDSNMGRGRLRKEYEAFVEDWSDDRYREQTDRIRLGMSGSDQAILDARARRKELEAGDA